MFPKEVHAAARIEIDRARHQVQAAEMTREALRRSHREALDRARREGENSGVRSVIGPIEEALKRGLREQLMDDMRLPLASKAEEIARTTAGRLVSNHLDGGRLSLARVYEQRAVRLEFHIPAMTRCLMVAE